MNPTCFICHELQRENLTIFSKVVKKFGYVFQSKVKVPLVRERYPRRRHLQETEILYFKKFADPRAAVVNPQGRMASKKWAIGGLNLQYNVNLNKKSRRDDWFQISFAFDSGHSLRDVIKYKCLN